MAAPLTPSAFEPRGKRPPPVRSAAPAACGACVTRALLERIYTMFETALDRARRR